jgi:hypothetical protein
MIEFRVEKIVRVEEDGSLLCRETKEGGYQVAMRGCRNERSTAQIRRWRRKGHESKTDK